MEGYCVKCKAKCEIKNGKNVLMKAKGGKQRNATKVCVQSAVPPSFASCLTNNYLWTLRPPVWLQALKMEVLSLVRLSPLDSSIF